MSIIKRARPQSLGELPRRAAARYPDKEAFIDGDMRMTYAEFERSVDAFAATLYELGLEKGHRLAILARNCWEYAVASFATARAGIILVPINFMLQAEEVAFILDHSDARGLIVDDSTLGVAAEAIELSSAEVGLRLRITRTSGISGEDSWQNIAELMEPRTEAFDGPVIDDDEPVRLMYTSGTESKPKGALLTSRALLWEYVTCIVDGGMSSNDRELHALPLYHCAQHDCFMGPDVYLGATSVILPAPDPDKVLRTIEKEKITKFFAPPTVWISLLRSPDFNKTDLSSLRKGYYGASPMPVEVLRELGERLPGVEFWNFYGQTEMSPVATILKPHEQIAKAGSAGRPALNVETMVVDENDQPVAVGQIGEIVHRSPHAMLGYLNDSEKTNEAFRNGWFHSGDLGVFDSDGYLTVVDRKKDVIKSGGENVASREVEEALYEIDGVSETAVLGLAHPRWVEAVTAVIALKDGASLTQEDVIAHAKEDLASYKVPKKVVFVSDLPRNPSGKILKRQLREQFEGLYDDEL